MIDLEDQSSKKRHLTSVYSQSSNELQLSLRKCNTTSNVIDLKDVDMTLCNTPGVEAVNVGTEVTPQSMRGSSLFTPGDTFWREAIQVADGMAQQGKDLSQQVLEESPGANKEVSPLPVKHIDFSCEDKNMAVNNMITPCNPVQSLSRLQETTSSCVITKRRADVLNQPNDNRTFTTPGTDIKSSNMNGFKSFENTPSSSVPPNDRLDISNWLPSEICNTYKKRGISKLYPWQVLL